MGNRQTKPAEKAPILRCCPDIRMCGYFTELRSVLAEHDISEDSCRSRLLNSDRFHTTLNCYLHVLCKHNSDYEVIHSLLTGTQPCDITRCVPFRRNCRRREDDAVQSRITKLYPVSSQYKHGDRDQFIARSQTLDAMHSYICHEYDIGQRLTNQDLELKSCDETDEAKQSDTAEAFLVSRKLARVRAALHDKHALYHRLCLNASARSERFVDASQFMDAGQLQAVAQQSQLPSVAYDFGVRYLYGDQKDQKNVGHTMPSPKYGSFKQEMTSGEHVSVTAEQWNILHARASGIISGTDVARSMKSVAASADISTTDDEHVHLLRAEHAVAVMLYCNFDQLQIAFCKTYRALSAAETVQQQMLRHSRYYYFGYFLKQCVKMFGDCCMDTHRERTLYRGLTHKFLFDFSCLVSPHINVPLSTTGNFATALQFAHSDDGMVLELGVVAAMQRFLCCVPFSDSPGESEHLFIQTRIKLLVKNILIVRDNVECKLIMRCMHYLHTWEDFDMDEMEPQNESQPPIYVAIEAVVKHMLEIEQLAAFDEYSQALLTMYQHEMPSVNIDLDVLNGYYSFLKPYLLRSYPTDAGDACFEFIHFENILKMYPNVRYIDASVSKYLSKTALDVMYGFLKSMQDVPNQMEAITMEPLSGHEMGLERGWTIEEHEKADLETTILKTLIDEYKSSFLALQWSLEVDMDELGRGLARKISVEKRANI